MSVKITLINSAQMPKNNNTYKFDTTQFCCSFITKKLLMLSPIQAGIFVGFV